MKLSITTTFVSCLLFLRLLVSCSAWTSSAHVFCYSRPSLCLHCRHQQLALTVTVVSQDLKTCGWVWILVTAARQDHCQRRAIAVDQHNYQLSTRPWRNYWQSAVTGYTCCQLAALCHSGYYQLWQLWPVTWSLSTDAAKKDYSPHVCVQLTGLL